MESIKRLSLSYLIRAGRIFLISSFNNIVKVVPVALDLDSEGAKKPETSEEYENRFFGAAEACLGGINVGGKVKVF